MEGSRAPRSLLAGALPRYPRGSRPQEGEGRLGTGKVTPSQARDVGMRRHSPSQHIPAAPCRLLPWVCGSPCPWESG